jgi:hypothetical protein
MPRTVLMHMNVTVPDEDERTVPELVQALEGAIEVGSDDPTVNALEVVLAEEVESTVVDYRDPKAIAAAKERWGSDELEFDLGARVIPLDEEGEHEGAAWVSAWVYVSAEEIARAKP